MIVGENIASRAAKGLPFAIMGGKEGGIPGIVSSLASNVVLSTGFDIAMSMIPAAKAAAAAGLVAKTAIGIGKMVGVAAGTVAASAGLNEVTNYFIGKKQEEKGTTPVVKKDLEKLQNQVNRIQYKQNLRG